MKQLSRNWQQGIERAWRAVEIARCRRGSACLRQTLDHAVEAVRGDALEPAFALAQSRDAVASETSRHFADEGGMSSGGPIGVENHDGAFA